jgi:hypothetical protein
MQGAVVGGDDDEGAGAGQVLQRRCALLARAASSGFEKQHRLAADAAE